jgi:ELWxxDGT repeat protein
MRISRTVLILIVVVCAAPSFGQTPFLVRDLNTTHASYSSSTPSSFVDLDGKIVFFAKTPASGREPWVVSGGIATPLRDVKPGVGDSLVPWFPLVSLGNGQALFAAYNPYGWTELWRTDGTPDGTARVKDIYPGGNADLSFPTVINGKAYFTANDGTNGSEPWVSDGTADGTFMLANLDGAASSSTVYGFISVGNRIFIFADGRLWIVDGSVFQVPVTIESSGGFIAAGNTVYMSAWTEDTGRELWKTDGTAAGTQLVRDIRPGPESSFSTFLLSSGTNAVFLATDDGSTWDLWKSDGTPEGTQVVKSNLAASSPRHLATVTGLSFFLANGATWRTDGTAEGTFPLFTGTSVSFVRAFDRMIFLRPVGAGWEIWTTDGTVAGTSRLLQRSVVGSNTSAFASAGGKLYFASETLLDGTEPWICEDGTDAGTRLLANIGPDSPGSSIPENLIAAKQFLYFRAHAGGATTELWRTDGTSSGTIQLTALGENGNSPWISLMTAWQGTLWFRHGATDLWRSNGDVAGTQPWSNPPTVDRLSPTSSLLFLEDHDARVWRTDGTQDGTRFLLTPQLMRDDPGGPAVEVAGRVYLSGSSLIPGLFRTDGTAESTKRILTFDTNELQSPYFAAAGALYFALRQTATGTELWRTDGTFEGTNLVKDISPGGSSSSPGAFAEMGPYLFFTADDGTHGRELWRSDGTGTGTILLRDIFAGTASAEIANATRVGNILYFTANDGSSGNELWRSDGTPEGTLRVMDLNPGSASSSPRDLVEAQGSLFFAAGDGLHGEELWQTTGVDSVMMVTDLEPGPSSSSPAEMTQAGSLLYFAATSSAGRELWALPLASSSLSISDARVAEGARHDENRTLRGHP